VQTSTTFDSVMKPYCENIRNNQYTFMYKNCSGTFKSPFKPKGNPSGSISIGTTENRSDKYNSGIDIDDVYTI
jgi:hypothetical protein